MDCCPSNRPESHKKQKKLPFRPSAAVAAVVGISLLVLACLADVLLDVASLFGKVFEHGRHLLLIVKGKTAQLAVGVL